VRFSRSTLFILLLLGTLGQVNTAYGAQTATQPASDPQAVAVVQAAITALGGATAIGQAQSWTFQATLQGPIANGSVGYTLGWDSGQAASVVQPNGTSKTARLTQSLFVPAVIAPVLLNQSQDPQFVMRYGGTTTINSKSVTAISFSVTAAPNFTSQTWWFDGTTGLPTRVQFQLPAEIGSRMSFPGLIDLSDYHTVSGISYPFRIVVLIGGRPPETITLQSVSSSTVAPSAAFDASSGDL